MENLVEGLVLHPNPARRCSFSFSTFSRLERCDKQSADEQGVASGLLSTGRVIGQALSVALAGTIFTSFGAAAAGVLLSSQGHNLSTSFFQAEDGIRVA